MRLFYLIGLVSISACAQVTAPDISLVGNFANPYAPVLAGLCDKCNIKACEDYNVLAQTCAQGLPIQGLMAAGVAGKACPDLGYPTSGAFSPRVPPQACIDAAIAAAQAPAASPASTPSSTR